MQNALELYLVVITLPHRISTALRSASKVTCNYKQCLLTRQYRQDLSLQAHSFAQIVSITFQVGHDPGIQSYTLARILAYNLIPWPGS